MRSQIRDFIMANPIYRNASVSFYTVSGGVRTNTLALLYADKIGSNTLSNPQRLNSEGRFARAVYIDDPVIALVSGINIPSHETGVIDLVATGVTVSPFSETVLDDTSANAWFSTLAISAFINVDAAGVGGTGNAITLTPATAQTSYAFGIGFSFVAEAVNTGAVTVNVSGLGAKDLTKAGNVALLPGEIRVGAIVQIMYDGTRFQWVARDALWLENAGALGDEGVTDDSAAIADFIAKQPKKLYKFGNRVLSNHDILDFRFQRAKSISPANYLVKLTDYASVVKDMYVSEANGPPYVFEFGESRYPRAQNLWILNAGGGGITLNPGAAACNKPVLQQIVLEGFSTNGVNMATNVSELEAYGVYLDSGTTPSNGKLVPKRGTTGWRQNTPLGSFARGGHSLIVVKVLNTEKGLWFTDSELTALLGCVADSNAGYGLVIDGASGNMTIESFFCGTNMGIYVGGTATNITFNNLTTRLIGVIPPWGDATPGAFFVAAGPYYAITVAGAADVLVDGSSWRGEKSASVAAGATLTVTGGIYRAWDTNATVAAGSPVYMDDDGASATESDTVFRAPYDCYLFAFDCHADGAPTGSDTFTYTARASGSDTALVATISGAATSSGKVYAATPIFVTRGTAITIRLDPSATAVARRHTGNLHILPK